MVAMVCNAYGVHCVRHSSQCLTLILLSNRCATVTCAHLFCVKYDRAASGRGLYHSPLREFINVYWQNNPMLWRTHAR